MEAIMIGIKILNQEKANIARHTEIEDGLAKRIIKRLS
jgi:hypothetical protein